MDLLHTIPRHGAPARAARTAFVALVALPLGSGSCFSTTTTLCEESGLRCRPGQTCAAAQPVCIDVGGCGDGRVGEGEVCDDGNIIDGDGCSGDCRSDETCGNGVSDLRVGETCDDGNRVSGDRCDSDCHEEPCGNLRLDPGEACDDGNLLSGDGCRDDCKSNEACGNGALDAHLGEECELQGPPFPFPGPVLDSPGCDNDCTFPRCGDGHLNLQHLVMGAGPPHLEQCDPGIIIMNVTMDSPGCDSDCTFVACGDGHVNQSLVNGRPLEDCESGGLDTAFCDGDCTFPMCGDNHTNPAHGEQCDPGGGSTPLDVESCDSDCTEPSCGDGHTNPAFTPPNGTIPEQCDTGTALSNELPDGCRTDCRAAFCGDGVIDSGEGCDPGGSYNKGSIGCVPGTICRSSGPMQCTCTM